MTRMPEEAPTHAPGSDPTGRDPGPRTRAQCRRGGSDATGPTPDDDLARAVAERDEYLDLLQRAKADFENYRKRAARDQERLVAHAHERLVRELLPVLDDLERALEAAERHEEAALVDGVKLVEQSLRKALEKEGLTEIETEGPFDPHVHEAMLAQPGTAPSRARCSRSSSAATASATRSSGPRG